jgi:hypothetical protein
MPSDVAAFTEDELYGRLSNVSNFLQIDDTVAALADASQLIVNSNQVWDWGVANYQPLEATLTDIADGTIAENLVNTANPWAVNEGGTGAATLTDGGILLGSGTGAITPLAQATNGQLPIGSTGADPVLATITGTASELTVTNGAGTITLSVDDDGHAHTSTSISGLDSTDITDNGLNVDDMNWEREYIELTIVHGWNAASADSTTLFLSNREGYTPILFVDSTNIASKKDTVYVSGTVPYDCVVDSAYVTYKCTGTNVLIDSLVLRGPDLSSFTNQCDSTYYSSGTNLDASSVTRQVLNLGAFTASAGHRFAVMFANDLAADNGTVKVYHIQLAVKR